MRLALRLAEFNYTVEHIPEESNLCADILTRWASPQNLLFPARRVSAFRGPTISEKRPELQSVQAIAEAQGNQPPSGDS